MQRPISNCYWVRPGTLLAGEYPGAIDPVEAKAKLARLLDSGIRKFIDLTEAGELRPYEAELIALAGERDLRIAYRRFPIIDNTVPSGAAMESILDSIDRNVAMGFPAYVHCFGGIGRTGTTVGCHLVRHGMTGSQALEHIAELWQVMEKRDRAPLSPHMRQQRRMVQRWRE
jgi:protein-tyrosine phosphatase